MIIVMNMSDHEIEHDESADEYGDEIMNTGWNPDVDSVHKQLQIVPGSEPTRMPDDLASVSAEIFLEKMHSYQLPLKQ